MKTLKLQLEVTPSGSYRCQRAANSLDIDTAKKLTHAFSVDADIDTDYNVGLIVGASGSGKTTLATHIWGEDAMRAALDLSRPIIDQFPESWSYDDCVAALTGIGLSQVTCWIRPASTLSNGQRARAECALMMSRGDDLTVMDEWTSVVDRTVAKAMSHTVQRYARKQGKRVVLLSCHYDVIEWLQPDWIIDCNKQEYVNRRLLRRQREEHLSFEIRRCERSAWRHFSRYHYLSDRLPGGTIETYGIYCNDDQIGFQCFANYVPHRGKGPMIMHSNRTVIHPDYVGFGLGIRVINITSMLMHQRGFKVMAKFSSVPVYTSMKRQSCWRYLGSDVSHSVVRGKSIGRETGYRLDVKAFKFEFVPSGFQDHECIAGANDATIPS